MTVVVEIVRWYNVAAAVLVIAAGTAQIRRWVGFAPSQRLVWQAAAGLNLTALIGSLEALRAGSAGGIRIYLLAIALTWLLAAVLHRPYTRWRTRQHGPTEEHP